MAFNIVSSGIYLPRHPWQADKLDQFLNLPEGTVNTKYGVSQKYVADNHETAMSMAGKAAQECLANANLIISDVDLVIYASGTHHQSLPYDAAGLLAFLNAPHYIESFDINSTCLSFLTALDLAQSLFIANRYQRILIVSSECATGVTLKNNQPVVDVASLFADGAAAFLLEKDQQACGLIMRRFETHHAGYAHCQIQGGGSHLNPHKLSYQENLQVCQFEMDGKKLFKTIRKVLPKFIAQGLNEADIAVNDIDYLLPHQASFHALKKLPKLTGFSTSQIVNNFAMLGNQVAASIPINLHLLRTDQGNNGKTVLLMGSAAGLSLGMGLIRL